MTMRLDYAEGTPEGNPIKLPSTSPCNKALPAERRGLIRAVRRRLAVAHGAVAPLLPGGGLRVGRAHRGHARLHALVALGLARVGHHHHAARARDGRRRRLGAGRGVALAALLALALVLATFAKVVFAFAKVVLAFPEEIVLPLPEEVLPLPEEVVGLAFAKVVLAALV